VFFRELLQAFADANQPYCLVGGVAVNLHGIPRMTYDVDIAVPTTRESLEGTEQILQRLGLRCRLPIRLGDLSDDVLREEYRRDRNLIAVTFTDPSDPLREVDVLVSPSVPATDLVARALSLDLDGIPVSLVTIEDLIALKRNTGRDQDAADIAHLERLKDVT
jgi:Nucleotidyl transferase AbiEii toxin, Type IV TA system